MVTVCDLEEGLSDVCMIGIVFKGNYRPRAASRLSSRPLIVSRVRAIAGPRAKVHVSWGQLVILIVISSLGFLLESRLQKHLSRELIVSITK